MTESSENIRSGKVTEEYASYTDQDLQVALQDFLEEDKGPENKVRMWNFKTIAGLVFLFVATSYFIELTGLSLLGPGLSNAVYWLPVVGGLIITVVGFGFFSRERKQARRNRKKEKKMYNNLNRKRSDSSEARTRSAASRFGLESYALKKNKKMFRSRTDKRMFGVCGGIARYFGISSTFVRLFFAIFTLLGYGFPFILYLALAVVLPKEPEALIGGDMGFDDI